MRALAASLLLLLCGCRRGLLFDSPPGMSPRKMLQKATLVFVVVIQTQQFDSGPFFPLITPDSDPNSAHYWKILRREVRIETRRGTSQHNRDL